MADQISLKDLHPHSPEDWKKIISLLRLIKETRLTDRADSNLAGDYVSRFLVLSELEPREIEYFDEDLEDESVRSYMKEVLGFIKTVLQYDSAYC